MRNERSSSARMGWELHAIATFALHRSTDATLADIQLSGRELADKLNMPDKTRSAASWVDRAGTFGLRHSRFIARSDRAELVAVADPAFGSDRPVPDELRDLARYTDHREMLARGDLDGVIVASPSEMHVSHALDCLDAGVAVLIEKPVAVDREQARPLLDRLVDDPEARVLVGHHRRHHPAVAAARSLIEEGRLGEIRTVAAIWATHKSDPYFEVEWRRRRPGGRDAPDQPDPRGGHAPPLGRRDRLGEGDRLEQGARSRSRTPRDSSCGSRTGPSAHWSVPTARYRRGVGTRPPRTTPPSPTTQGSPAF